MLNYNYSSIPFFIIFSFSFFVSSNSFGQLGDAIIIDDDLSTPSTLLILDMDMDSDNDILFMEQDSSFWYENFDGFGDFGEREFVPYLKGRLGKLNDIDNDGDLDIVTAGTNYIAWHENEDGQNNFGPENIVIADSPTLADLFIEDIDGDGDMDLIPSAEGIRQNFLV